MQNIEQEKLPACIAGEVYVNQDFTCYTIHFENNQEAIDFSVDFEFKVA